MKIIMGGMRPAVRNIFGVLVFRPGRMLLLGIFVFFYGVGLISMAKELPPFPWIREFAEQSLGVPFGDKATPEFDPGAVTDIERAANVPELIRFRSTQDTKKIRNILAGVIWDGKQPPQWEAGAVRPAKSLDWQDLDGLKESRRFVVLQPHGLDSAIDILIPMASASGFIVWLSHDVVPPDFLETLLSHGQMLALVSLPTQGDTPRPLVETDHGMILFTYLDHLNFLRSRESVEPYIFAPVTQAVNFLASMSNSTCIDIVGISQTAIIAAVQAAIDTRICASISLIAPSPHFLYRTQFQEKPHTANIYQHVNRLEIATLAGLGRGRSHTQVQLAHDARSGGGAKTELYASDVNRAIQSLGEGEFSAIEDDTTIHHELSKLMQRVILETLAQ